MKYLKTYKIFENPNHIFADIRGKWLDLNFDDEDALPFFYDTELKILFVGQSKKDGIYYIHPELINIVNKHRSMKGFSPLSINDTNLLISGRIWIGRKVISFWTYPHKSIFNTIIDELESKSSVNIWNNNWLIEVIIGDDDKPVKNLPYNWKNNTAMEKGIIKLIPVEDYDKSKNFNRENHVLSPLYKTKTQTQTHITTRKYKPSKMTDIEYKKMMKNLYQERYENTSTKPKRKKKKINYEAIINNIKGNPIMYVTKFKLKKLEDDWMTCVAKGYRKKQIEGYKTEVWVSFNKELKIDKKSFKHGEIDLLVIDSI